MAASFKSILYHLSCLVKYKCIQYYWVSHKLVTNIAEIQWFQAYLFKNLLKIRDICKSSKYKEKRVYTL